MKTFDAGKTRMIGLPHGEKKLLRYVKPLSSDTGTLLTDGRTHRRTDLLYEYRASAYRRAIKIKQNHDTLTERCSSD